MSISAETLPASSDEPHQNATDAWATRDRKPVRLTGGLTENDVEPCRHDNTVLMRFDPDELGEHDCFTPSRAIVCIGCEAIRWTVHAPGVL